MNKLIARHETQHDSGKGWTRLERHLDDGCAPHVLCMWQPVADHKAAQRYARQNGAELVTVYPT